jgi:lipopolysaccharide export system permease protein
MPFLFGVLVLSLIAAGGSILPTVVDIATRYHMSAGLATLSFIYRMPEAVKVTFLAAALLGALLTFGRFSGESEITAFRAGGVSLYKVMKPVLVFGLLVSLLSFTWNELIVPQANFQKESILNEASQSKQTRPRLEEKVNLSSFENGFLKRLIYANRLEGEEMKEVSIIEYDQGEFSRIIFAKTALWQKQGGWLFKDGTVYQFSGNKKSAFVMEFKEELINISTRPGDISKYEKNPNDMDVWELTKHIQAQALAAKNTNGLQLLWHERFATPAAALVFVILGAPMGIRNIRSPSGIGIVTTIMIVIGYYLLASVFHSLNASGLLAPMLAAWLPNVLVGGYGFKVLINKANGFQ